MFSVAGIGKDVTPRNSHAASGSGSWSYQGLSAKTAAVTASPLPCRCLLLPINRWSLGPSLQPALTF